ncbi:hypothetical protein H5410_047404 [Solanum commersonii]|uniref:Uncharacterized protein n=1 Tax=Solanum commersonii TaxID=4109 RepID=A0A9J5XH03_SOLCO|nr:hypothetical protein H5410_047404 [Solanum commersonii]
MVGIVPDAFGFMTPLIFATIVMSTSEKKSFERFVRILPPNFDSVTGILETHEESYTSFQFTSVAKEWRRSMLPVGPLVFPK